jgi:hypothetical protein
LQALIKEFKSKTLAPLQTLIEDIKSEINAKKLAEGPEVKGTLPASLLLKC